MRKTKRNLGKRAISVAAPRVWNELPITSKTSETITSEKSQDIYIYIYIPNCISTINLRLSLVLIITFARAFSRLCLMILKLIIIINILLVEMATENINYRLID